MNTTEVVDKGYLETSSNFLKKFLEIARTRSFFTGLIVGSLLYSLFGDFLILLLFAVTLSKFLTLEVK